MVITQLTAIGVHPLSIAIQTISRIVLSALKPLREALVQLPSTFPLFAHYKLGRGESIQFAGRGQFLETTLSHTLEHGFSWNGVLRISTQAERGIRVLYELANSNDIAPRLTLSINSAGDLRIEAQINEHAILHAQTSQFSHTPFFGKFCYIGLHLRYKTNGAGLAF